jgi:hypothetical protein
MEPMQLAAIETLVANQYFSAEAFDNDEIEATDKVVPIDIKERINALNSQEADLMSFLDVLSQYPTSGDSGLKARTGLLEYRYDAI